MFMQNLMKKRGKLSIAFVIEITIKLVKQTKLRRKIEVCFLKRPDLFKKCGV